jgi:hypothetical protein
MTTKRPKSLRAGLLPTSGYIQLSSVIDAIVNAPDTLHVGRQLSLRTLLVFRSSDQTWVHLITTSRLKLVDGPIPEPLDITFGPFAVLGRVVDVGVIKDEPSLNQTLKFWHEHVPNRSDVSGFQNGFARRMSSRNEWDVFPAWILDLAPAGPHLNWEKSVAEGPFFDQDRRWFSKDFKGVVQGWLDCPPVYDENSNAPAVAVLIPDRRGRLEGLSIEDGALLVRVEGALAEFDCTVTATDFDNQPHKIVQRFRGASTSIPLARVFKNIEIHLWTIQEEILDHYYENESYSTWHRFILRPGNEPTPGVEDLLLACERGEGDQIEFKEWLAPERSSKKSVELLEVAVAFANAKGGALYIGVTDDGELVGVESQLRRTLSPTKGADLTALRDEYAKCLKKLIAEGVVPSMYPRVEWIDQAGLQFLTIHIPKGLDAPYQILENGRFLMRRGASNRAMSKADIEAAINGR